MRWLQTRQEHERRGSRSEYCAYTALHRCVHTLLISLFCCQPLTPYPVRLCLRHPRIVCRQGKDHIPSLAELAEAGREDDEAAGDAATLKARNFDDWKDGVPKGMGNTKRI